MPVFLTGNDAKIIIPLFSSIDLLKLDTVLTKKNKTLRIKNLFPRLPDKVEKVKNQPNDALPTHNKRKIKEF